MSISRSIVRPLQKSVTRSVIQGAVTDPLQELIKQLFGNGEQGALVFAKPTVAGVQSAYQDVSATTPANSEDAPLGYLTDQSGSGINLTQPSSSARPLYDDQFFAKMDQTDDFLDTGVESFGSASLYADLSQTWFVGIPFSQSSSSAGTLLARGGVDESLRTFQIILADNLIWFVCRGEPTTTSLPVGLSEKLFVWANWDGITLTAGITGEVPVSVPVGSASEEVGQRIVIGARTNGTGYRTNASVGGLVLVDRSLSEREIASLESIMINQNI